MAYDDAAPTLFLHMFLATPLRAQKTPRTLPEIGNTMRGIFLQYWNQHGGHAHE